MTNKPKKRKEVSKEFMMRMIKECKREWLAWFIDLVSDDAYAVKFQSMAKYRIALINAIKEEL